MAQAIWAASSTREIWDVALRELVLAFDADAGLGFVQLSAQRLQIAARHRWPGDEHDAPMPIAPDSQAAFILGNSRPVISPDLLAERRFLPAAPITRLGYSSSMSVRLTSSTGVMGLLGVYSRRANAFDPAVANDFATLADMVAKGLDQAQRLAATEYRATHDELTGLLSRSAILDQLEVSLGSGAPTSVLSIDLDGFKAINDRHGHPVGDQVLQVIAERLRTEAGSSAHVGRLGGDEFFVVCASDDLVDLHLRAEHLIGACETLVTLDALELEVSASIGLAVADPDDSPHDLLRRVDRALYRAKGDGRGRVRTAPGTDAGSRRPIVLPAASLGDATVSLVREAIGEVRAVFQPIVDRDGALVGVEALTRGPVGSPLETPNVLFEAATTFGCLPELELAAKRAAFAAGVPPQLRLFVNLEPAAVERPEWLDELADAWLTGGAHPLVTVELTERALIASPGRLLHTVAFCRSLGWSIALDDVGARSDSVAALRLVKPDVVKLDISLIQGKGGNHATRVSTSVATYGDRHQIDIVAEGVEHPEQMVMGEMLGANLFQGYRFGRPGPLDAITSASAERPPPVTTAQPRVATKRQLLAISRHLESEATSSDCVLLASVQHTRFYTDRTRRQYEALARRCAFVGVVGQELGSTTHNGVRLAPVDAGDPLARRWWVVLLSSHASLAMLAEELDEPASPDAPSTAEADRRFRYRFVTEPDEVEAAALELFARF